MSERKYRYRREDFGELPVRLDHMTIRINFFEDRVDAANCLEMTARRDLSEVMLDARELLVHQVEWCRGSDERVAEPLVYQYMKGDNKLSVKLPWMVKAGERFMIRTATSCSPSEHILEGIYKDTTPPGAPQQYMSQCQQWGFQRIMPVLDDCTAKCTMTTTIEADSHYSQRQYLPQD